MSGLRKYDYVNYGDPQPIVMEDLAYGDFYAVDQVDQKVKSMIESYDAEENSVIDLMDILERDIEMETDQEKKDWMIRVNRDQLNRKYAIMEFKKKLWELIENDY